MSVLIIAEHDNQTLNGNLSHCVTAATQLDADVHVLLAGSNCADIAESAAVIDGVGKVLVAESATLEHQLAEDINTVVQNIAGAYSYIIAAASTTGKNLIPRVAACLDVQALSDVSRVVSPDTFERPVYAGNVIATVQSLDATKVLTIRTTAFDAAASSDACSIEKIEVEQTEPLSQFVSEELAESDRPELTSASIVISGGRGLQNSDNFNLLYNLADKLGAAVGASRAAVDAGYVPNDMQVGQTGKIVAPDLYIAVGISGAIQHLAGMKDSKVIVAINKDEDAPIFQVADYGLVADLFDVIPEIDALLG